jgi:hypothetical protein
MAITEADKPVGPLGIADSLRKRRHLVAGHPDRIGIHPEPKRRLSAVGAEPFILYFPECLPAIFLEGLPAVCRAGLLP